MSKNRKCAALLIGLLLFTGLLAGCSDDKDTYAADVNDILLPLGQDLQSLGTEVSNSNDPAEIGKAVGDAEQSIDEAVGELEQLTPPEDAQGVQDDLIAALNGFGDDLGTVSDAANSGNLAKLQKAALALPDAANEFQAKLTDIEAAANDAGVDFGSTEGE